MSAADLCPPSAPFFGFMGVAVVVVFCNLGAAYGTAKSGVGLASMGIMKPELVMRNIIPVVMAGVLGIYGLIVGAILVAKIQPPTFHPADGNNPTEYWQSAYTSYDGYAHLASGLACGLSSLAAGLAIGVVGDAGVRAIGQQQDLFVGMILILIFGEALGLYGLIVSLILSQQGAASGVCPQMMS